MAKLLILAVRDRAVDAYMRPFPAPTVGAAVRGFLDELSRSESELAKHPDDYDLYQLAVWDEESGVFEQDIKKVCDGKQMGGK